MRQSPNHHPLLTGNSGDFDFSSSKSYISLLEALHCGDKQLVKTLHAASIYNPQNQNSETPAHFYPLSPVPTPHPQMGKGYRWLVHKCYLVCPM